MNLKNKLALIVSLLFTVIFAVSATLIYLLFADFRKDEFEGRLKEKAISSIKLLVEVEQVDRQLLKIINQNTIHKLYDEKILIFDAEYNLIYSSLDDIRIKWTIDDLKYLKINKAFFRREKQQEVYGFFYDTNDQDYYALVSASDNSGKRKLEYLFYILIATYIFFTILVWFITYYIIKRLLSPLDSFHNKLKSINEHNLKTKIDVKNKNDEIDLLANEFNQMLQRIDLSYQKQKEFTAHASHELRTPIARVIAQIENKISVGIQPGERSFLQRILDDISQISELIASLLLLSKAENRNNEEYESCRIDELIDEASRKVSRQYPDFKLKFNIGENEAMENYLEINGTRSLLEIAFTNLLKNAYLYSESKQVTVTMSAFNDGLLLSVSNDGETLTQEEQADLFQPFMRGQNSKKQSGLGLGLRIVQRILAEHHADIRYEAGDKSLNTFHITFKS